MEPQMCTLIMKKWTLCDPTTPCVCLWVWWVCPQWINTTHSRASSL